MYLFCKIVLFFNELYNFRWEYMILLRNVFLIFLRKFFKIVKDVLLIWFEWYVLCGSLFLLYYWNVKRKCKMIKLSWYIKFFGIIVKLYVYVNCIVLLSDELKILYIV